MSFDRRHSYRNKCPQCAEQNAELRQQDKGKGNTKNSPYLKAGQVISIRDYLNQRLSHTKKELSSIEKKTSQLMSHLIREQDQSAARKLQREIGLLERDHTELSRQRTHYKSLKKKFTV